MNETKFIELLNLYVDQEISPAEAAELEQEIARNPQRRLVYQQYCRIHRASVMLGASFKTGGVQAGEKFLRANLAADEKVVGFPEQSGRRVASWAWLSGLGIAAAAACVAFVVVRNDDATLSPNAALSPALASNSPASTPTQTAVSVLQPVVGPQAFDSTLSSRPYVTLASVEAPALRSPTPSLAWMDRVQLPSVRTVSAEDLVFRPKSEGSPESTLFRVDSSAENKVEMTAFQFQK